MKSETKFLEIATITDSENGEVTMFVNNEKWGPIVTGPTAAEAKTKMSEAFLLSLIANTFWTNELESGLAPLPMDTITNGLGKATNTLSNSY